MDKWSPYCLDANALIVKPLGLSLGDRSDVGV
jgi:hypothetical protein